MVLILSTRPDAKALAVRDKIFATAAKNVSRGDPLLLLKYFLLQEFFLQRAPVCTTERLVCITYLFSFVIRLPKSFVIQRKSMQEKERAPEPELGIAVALATLALAISAETGRSAFSTIILKN